MTLLDWMTSEVMAGVEPLGLHPSIKSAVEDAVADRLESELPGPAASADVAPGLKAQVRPAVDELRSEVVDVAKALRHKAAQMAGQPDEIAEAVAEGMRKAI